MSSLASAPPNVGTSDDIIVPVAICLPIAVVVVALRFATRFWIVQRVRWDDWTILQALIAYIFAVIFGLLIVHYSGGRHQVYLTDHQIREFTKSRYGEWIAVFATLMWTKVSLCLFLLHIPTNKVVIRSLQGMIIFLIVSNVIGTILWVVQCRPLQGAWIEDVQATCFSREQKEVIILVQGIISAVCDYVLACYPILILWRVQLEPRTKAGLCCLMGLGVVTGTCCVVRTALNSQSLPQDSTYSGFAVIQWRGFEQSFGIVAACIPPLRPGYIWLRSKLRVAKRSTTDHLPLTDRPPTGKLSAEAINRPPDIYSVEVDHCVPTNTEGSLSTLEGGQIRKTTRVDVEQGSKVDVSWDYQIEGRVWEQNA